MVSFSIRVRHRPNRPRTSQVQPNYIELHYNVSLPRNTPMLEDPSDNMCEGKSSQIERLETYLPGSLTPPTFLPL